MMNEANPLYEALGKRLKYARELKEQSLAEVSGAVEIEETALDLIEAGKERPSEDILLLLISHFGIQDAEAVQLWEMANYGGELPDELKTELDLQGANKVVMLIAQDVRSLYSDGVDVTVTNAGVNISFTQSSGKGQTLPVAKVGMSLDQAQAVIKTMQLAILKANLGQHIRSLPSKTDKS